MIILIIIALIIIGFGCFYSKKIHKKVFSDGNLPGTDNIAGIILLFILMLLGYLPWYIMKAVIVLLGIFIIYWALSITY